MSAPTSSENFMVIACTLKPSPVKVAKTIAIIRLKVYSDVIFVNSSSVLPEPYSPDSSAPPTPTSATQRTIMKAPRTSNLVTFCPYLKKNIMMVKTQLEAKMLDIIPALTPLGKAKANVHMIKMVITPCTRALITGTDSRRPLNKTMTFGAFLGETPSAFS